MTKLKDLNQSGNALRDLLQVADDRTPDIREKIQEHINDQINACRLMYLVFGILKPITITPEIRDGSFGFCCELDVADDLNRLQEMSIDEIYARIGARYAEEAKQKPKVRHPMASLLESLKEIAEEEKNKAA